MLLAAAGLRVLVVDRSRLRRRHPVDPRPHARRGRPAPPLGSPRPRRRRRHPAGPARHVPLRRRRGDHHHQARPRRRRPLRAAPHRPRPDARRRRGGGGCRGPLRDHRHRLVRNDRAGSPGSRSRRRRPPDAGVGPVVIGADGMRSTVARRAGAPPRTAGTAASALVYGYWSGVDTDGYEWVFRPDACAGVIPTNDGLACVFAAATPAHRAGRRGHPLRRRRRASPDSPRGWRRRRPRRRPHLRGRGHLRRSWGPGWALVGDAGYWKDPISAHGLTDALRDAELLARAIVAICGDGADEREALAAYQATRDDLSADCSPLSTSSPASAGPTPRSGPAAATQRGGGRRGRECSRRCRPSDGVLRSAVRSARRPPTRPRRRVVRRW